MKTVNYWIAAIMALSFSLTCVSCSDNDNTENKENTTPEETPIADRVSGDYKYDSKLSLSVMGKDQGSTTESNIVIKRKSDTTVDVVINGFSKIAIGSMSLGDFTVSGVTVAAGEKDSYTLSFGEFEAESGATPITGKSLIGTIAADGTADIAVVFSPGSMPMPITGNFTGSIKQSGAK